MKTNKAFTLAEVLVTLMIIGVIAAVTIPTLNQNIKHNQYVAGCLKANSVLSQAINKMKIEMGPIGLGSKWNSDEEVWNAFVKQMNVVKVCSGNNIDSCFISKNRRLNKIEETSYSFHALIATDGMSYNYTSASSISAWTNGRYGISESVKAIGRFIVDVNGQKAPNRAGIDRFYFVLLKGEGIVPAGRDDSSNCNYSDLGFSCAAKVIKEKKIDYPKS